MFSLICCFFFFSSRRRHTRWPRDWSSDVCSSDLGRIRLRKQGGHGGHNGVRSTIEHVGTKKFKRLRVGIGRPTTAQPIVDYVLENFRKEEREEADLGIQLAADACEAWLHRSFDDVMNEFN